MGRRVPNLDQSLLATLVGATIALTTGPATAQDLPVSEPAPQPYDATVPVDATKAPEDQVAVPEAKASRVIEEIVVTAQKREENLQDVPVSIAAFSGDQLDALGIDSVRDLGTTIPALQITDFAGYSLIYIRGIGTDSFFPSADSSVATYIDGVFFPAGHTLGESFGKVKRVEVLKGPQGTLFGRNATGGAINIITEPPSFEPGGSVKLSYGRFNDLRTRASTNIPLSDWFSINASGVYNLGDSYYDREATTGRDAGKPLRDELTRAGRLQLRIAPSDDIDIVLSGILSRASGAGSSLSVNTMPSVLGQAALITPETREFITTNDSAPTVRNATNAYYGTLTWNLPWFDAKILGSDYEVVTTEFAVDFDGSPQPLVTSQGVNEFQENRTAELQLVSNADTWGADWLEWTAGVYYYESTGGYLPVQLSVANSSIALPGGEIARLVPQGLLDLLPVLGQLPAPEVVGAFLTGVVGAESYSGYLQGTLRPTEWLGITLGGRYQEETRSLIESTIALRNIDGGRTNAVSFAQQEDKRSNFAPKVAVELNLIDDVLLYLSYQKGFKSSTYNVVNVTTPPSFVKPEEVSAYEIGVKSTLLDGNLRLNGAVFQNDVKDLQASFVSLFAGGLARFLNVGEARVRGVEFDFLWVPMPDVNPGLVATGGASLLDPEYTDFTDADGFDPDTGLYSTGNDFSGNRIVRTAKFTGTFGLSQTMQTGIGPIELGADVTHNSGFYFEASNNPNSFEPKYSVVSARLSYLYEPWDIRVTAFGNNLTDERYNVSQFRTDFGRLDTLAQPVTYGMSLIWNF